MKNKFEVFSFKLDRKKSNRFFFSILQNLNIPSSFTQYRWLEGCVAYEKKSSGQNK